MSGSGEPVIRHLGVAGIAKKSNPGKSWFIYDVSPSRYSTLRMLGLARTRSYP